MALELIITSPGPDGFLKAIEWNHEEIKAEVAAKVEHYKSLAYTEENVKDAKADVAQLRKFKTALESQKTAVKKQLLEPYTDFATKVDEITAIVQEPIDIIAGQLEEFEENRKAEKLDKLKQAFAAMNPPEGLPFERVFVDKMLNVTFSEKQAKQYFIDGIDKFNREVETIKNIGYFAEEALETYKQTFDLSQALQKAQILEAQRKQEEERERLRIERERQEAERREMERQRAIQEAEIARQKAIQEAEAARIRAEQEAELRRQREAQEAELARQRAEHEAELKRQREAQEAELRRKEAERLEMERARKEAIANASKDAPKTWVALKVLVSDAQAAALGMYLDENGIEYDPVEEITESEKDDLLHYECMKQAGVDNWEGYDIACDLYREYKGEQED